MCFPLSPRIGEATFVLFVAVLTCSSPYRRKALKALLRKET